MLLNEDLGIAKYEPNVLGRPEVIRGPIVGDTTREKMVSEYLGKGHLINRVYKCRKHNSLHSLVIGDVLLNDTMKTDVMLALYDTWNGVEQKPTDTEKIKYIRFDDRYTYIFTLDQENVL